MPHPNLKGKYNIYDKITNYMEQLFRNKMFNKINSTMPLKIKMISIIKKKIDTLMENG